MLKRFVLLSLISVGVLGALDAASSLPSDNPYQHYLRALLLENQGNYDGALAELTIAANQAPQSAYLRQTMAQLQVRQGQSDKAVESIEKALELDPDNSKSLLIAGQIYWIRGESEKAEARLSRAINVNPDDTDALVSLAGTVTPRDPKKAIALYQNFLNRNPGNVEIQEQIAQLYQALGDKENAKKSWLKALDIEPNAPKAHLALAQLAEVEFDTTTAIMHYEAVLAQDSSNLPLLLRVGELRYRNNDMAQATEAFQKAQSIAPGSASASFWLAILAENRGDFAEAIRLLEPIEKKVNDPGVSLRLSYYYSQQKRQTEAIQILEKLTKRDPSNQDFLNYLAIAYEDVKDYGRAEVTLTKLLALAPNDPEVHFHLGTLNDRRGHYKEAEANLKRAIELKPDYHSAMNYLGYTYAERNIHLNDAEHLLNDAIALYPDSPAYMDSLGWIYYKLGKYKKAEDFLKTAAERSSDPLIYDHLGDALAAQGRVDETVMVWDKSLRIAPGQKTLRKKLSKYIAALPEKSKQSLFIKRALANFEDIALIVSVIKLKACDKGPCFESMGQFDYQAKKSLDIEIPGPLSGPLMKVTKKYGKPAQYGAIHPQLQSADFYVTRACGRMEEFLSGRVFGAAPARVRFDFNSRDGALNAIHWSDDAGDDQIRQSGLLIAASSTAAPWMEWIDSKSGFRIRLEFKKPAITTVTAQKDSSDDNE